jgi:hypothetical protein
METNLSRPNHKRNPPYRASGKISETDYATRLRAEAQECLTSHPEAQEELYAFRLWFARDPEQCLSNARSRDIVRACKFLSLPSWDDLRTQIIKKGVPNSLADLFADYMAGYKLVSEWEPHRGLDSALNPQSTENVSFEQAKRLGMLKGKPISTWRKTKRLLKKSGLDSNPGAHPPHTEHLKSKIFDERRFIECHSK